MDERKTKPRGPLHWLKDRSRRFWIVAAILVPVVYLLGSGPTRTIAFRKHISYKAIPGVAQPVLYLRLQGSAWWLIFYAPLLWASDEPWGKPINVYWQLFPVPTIVEKS